MHEQFPSQIKRESSILDDMGKLIALSNKLESVYEHRPNIDNFIGAMAGTKHEKEYTREAVEADKKYEKETRDKIDLSNSTYGSNTQNRIEGGFQLSEMLQAMVVDCTNKYWFKDCKSIMTSDYDDLKVGIDAVMQHKKGGYLGFAFDFTISNQDKIIYNKLENGWQKNIKDGKVPVLKYFEDPKTNQKGSLLVPKFIIGASKKDVETFADAYLNNNAEVLKNHPFQYLMLLQIEEQLQTVLDYYETHEKDERLEFAKLQYKKIETILRNMKSEIHADEEMQSMKLYEYTKSSIALETMRKFRITHN